MASKSDPCPTKETMWKYYNGTDSSNGMYTPANDGDGHFKLVCEWEAEGTEQLAIWMEVALIWEDKEHGIGMGIKNAFLSFFWALSTSIHFHLTSFLWPEAYFTSSYGRFIPNSILNSIPRIIFTPYQPLFINWVSTIDLSTWELHLSKFSDFSWEVCVHIKTKKNEQNLYIHYL